MFSDLPILYLFKVTFRLRSWDCFGQTELGLNVRGCGREAIVCCQGPKRTALKLYNFNPRIHLGSAAWQAAANEALQVRCGDRFLSSLKLKSLPLLPHLYSTAIHSRWILIWGIWMVYGHWSQEEKNASCSFILRKALKEQLYIYFILAYFPTLWLHSKPSSLAEQNERVCTSHETPTLKHTCCWMCQSLETSPPLGSWNIICVSIIKSTVLILNQYHSKELMLISLLQKVLMLLWDLLATVR